MPELPEVETIRRGLKPRIVGREIHQVVGDSSRVFQSDPQQLAQAMEGQRIRNLRRRGKNLLLGLERHCCLIHLGMSGQLTFRHPAREDSKAFIRHPTTGLQRIRQHSPDKHTHFQILFRDGAAVLFRDIRMFGKIRLFQLSSDELSRHLSSLGPEPLSKEYTFSAFSRSIGQRKTRIKSLLLDQSFIAGIGNIYADEALFEARIHPERRVDELTGPEKKRLHAAVPGVLRRGLDFGGTSLRDYIDSEGRQGSNQEELAVYGRAGAPCPHCGSPVEKIVVAQRGTHYCPQCQRR